MPRLCGFQNALGTHLEGRYGVYTENIADTCSVVIQGHYDIFWYPLLNVRSRLVGGEKTWELNSPCIEQVHDKKVKMIIVSTFIACLVCQNGAHKVLKFFVASISWFPFVSATSCSTRWRLFLCPCFSHFVKSSLAHVAVLWNNKSLYSGMFPLKKSEVILRYGKMSGICVNLLSETKTLAILCNWTTAIRVFLIETPKKDKK